MKKLSRKNVLRNEIPGQMSIEDFPEYLPESYIRGGQMSRAEVRRWKRENEKKAKTFVMTAEELQKVRLQEREKVKQELREREDELAEQIWFMLLAIPTNVLIADYWPKTARKRIPEFVEKCMDLYQAWEQGAVDMTQMQALTEEYAKIKLVKEGTATAKVAKKM